MFARRRVVVDAERVAAAGVDTHVVQHPQHVVVVRQGDDVAVRQVQGREKEKLVE